MTQLGFFARVRTEPAALISYPATKRPTLIETDCHMTFHTRGPTASLAVAIIVCCCCCFLCYFCRVMAAFVVPPYHYSCHRHSPPNRFVWYEAAAKTKTTTATMTLFASSPLQDLNVAIVGGGPAGLLLALRLGSAGATVNVLEKQAPPSSTVPIGYALGIGLRGKMACQSANVWDAVTKYGMFSGRFWVHLGPLRISLRDPTDGTEPSLCLFQSDLCRALANEFIAMASQSSNKNQMQLFYDCGVTDLDVKTNTLTTSDNRRQSYDLVVGCDGVNSAVRKALAKAWPDFETTQELLSTVFKAVHLSSVPPLLDPMAVQMLLPKSGTVGAIIVPTANGTCCVNFQTQKYGKTDILLSSSNTNQTALVETLENRFPKLLGADLESLAQQLLAIKEVAQPSHVKCNTYHYAGKVALVGDAAHGGVQQGLNSALQDSAFLADCLLQFYNPDSSKRESLQAALLTYSQRAVPENMALDDLSFGPSPKSALKRVRFVVKSIRDTLVKGKWKIGELPLHTLLTTSLQPFTEIRKARDKYYDEPFPDQAYWNATLAQLDAKSRSRKEMKQRQRSDCG